MKYDVLSVDQKTNVVTVIAEDKTLRNAEAIVEMAVIRRGVESEIFIEVAAGNYKTGEQYEGQI
jgi:hypothetical protein